MTVDVTAEASFDNYPFDSYTAVGIVKVWHTASWHRACVQMDVPCLAYMVPCCTGIRIRVGVGTGMLPPCQHGPALVGVGCVIYPRMTAGVTQADVVAQLTPAYAHSLLAVTAKLDTTITADMRQNVEEWTSEQAQIYGDLGSNRGGSLDITVYPSIRMTLLPYIQGWAYADVSVQPITEVYVPVMTLVWTTPLHCKRVSSTGQCWSTKSPTRAQSSQRPLQWLCQVIMWILAAYQLVLAADHVIVRRRDLQPDTVGAAVGLVFALPALQLLMDAPLGR